MVSEISPLSVKVFAEMILILVKPEEALFDLWILYLVLPVWLGAASQSSFRLVSLMTVTFKLATLILPSTHFCGSRLLAQPKVQVCPEPLGPEPRPSQVLRVLPRQ